ncbi:MAG: RNA 3'-phosphate cyclase [Nitrospirae bacterium]|nr:RNA 3'-phosphate cyclase [Nitrospirota bacterium]
MSEANSNAAVRYNLAMNRGILEIDGGFGEAGGQILRTALSLSCLLGRPFRMFNIRKGRGKPGLMPQHLTCVRALQQISKAKVSGDSHGSTDITFVPSETEPGEYVFDIQTAGSTSLLLQAILPPLVFAKGSCSITLKGGTHVPFSPTFQYISEVFIPMLHRLGIEVHARIERYGFYPKGGGEIRIETIPSKSVSAINLPERGEIREVSGVSGVASLPISIAERQKNSMVRIISGHGLQADIELVEVSSFGKGTFVFLKPEADNCIAGFSSPGEIGKPAEKVGGEAAAEFLDYFFSGACLDPHISDQIVPYLALAKGSSAFTTSRISNHLLTNLWLIRQFTGTECIVDGEKGKPGRITLCS